MCGQALGSDESDDGSSDDSRSGNSDSGLGSGSGSDSGLGSGLTPGIGAEPGGDVQHGSDDEAGGAQQWPQGMLPAATPGDDYDSDDGVDGCGPVAFEMAARPRFQGDPPYGMKMVNLGK